jgi:hypothetical protein
MDGCETWRYPNRQPALLPASRWLSRSHPASCVVWSEGNGGPFCHTNFVGALETSPGNALELWKIRATPCRRQRAVEDIDTTATRRCPRRRWAVGASHPLEWVGRSESVESHQGPQQAQPLATAHWWPMKPLMSLS